MSVDNLRGKPTGTEASTVGEDYQAIEPTLSRLARKGTQIATHLEANPHDDQAREDLWLVDQEAKKVAGY